MNKYLKALKEGREVVVICDDAECASAIYWMQDGRIKCFSRYMGVIEHTASPEEIAEELQHLENEDCRLWIRGYKREDCPV